MKKIIASLMLLVSFALTGCGTIESNEVGVRTTWDGEVKLQEEGQGLYFAVLSSMESYSTKEITVELDDMSPKAGDNLSLADMDVEVFYTIEPSGVAEMEVKYSGKSASVGFGADLPMYYLVRSTARDAIYDTVSKYDSLVVHQSRDEIGGAIRERVQTKLDINDPNMFKVTRVIIRDVKTDPSIEKSIRLAVQKGKELDAKNIELEIAKKQKEINDAVTLSLSKEILRQYELDAMVEACSKGNTCIIDFTGGQTGVLIQK